uniref:Uncharacterized protein n=1 Tax=Meloidogyne enterolobii TaxID=390850 RepID=A0A6V7UDK8_MELEN|nr:unnamed protein product [Meloidogyne enterolobii]
MVDLLLIRFGELFRIFLITFVFQWKKAISESIFLFSNSFESHRKFVIEMEKLLDGNNHFCSLSTLPNIPKNIEEMIILRCWLEKIFNYAFEYVYFNEIVFNPELINLLFDNDKTIPLQFNIQECCLLTENNKLDDISKFTLNHLTISESLTFNFKQTDITEKNINILFKILTNGRQRLPKVCLNSFNSVDLAKLYDLIIQCITTSDCSKIVPIIILNYISSSTFQLNKRSENIKIGTFDCVANIYNPKVKFSFCNEQWIDNGIVRIHVRIMKVEL